MQKELPLFEAYPGLWENVGWISLGDYPTPVGRLANLERRLRAQEIWVKRDDLSSEIYGGNKLRALEFLLADAKRKGAKSIITGAGIGSNYGAAVSAHSGRLGIRPKLLFFRRPITEEVKETLLLTHHFGAAMQYARSYPEFAFKTLKEYLAELRKGGKPYFIVPGGSTPLSTLGYVNAAFELKEQIEGGKMPEPDYIMLPLGSGGTMAGLVLGLRLLGMKSEVIGVRITTRFVANRLTVLFLIKGALGIIRRFPIKVSISSRDINILHGYLGRGYGYHTKEGVEAMEIAAQEEELRLDGTYTGKAFAAFLDFVKEKRGKGVFLFWNTFSSGNYTKVLKGVDWQLLPEELHKFFN